MKKSFNPPAPKHLVQGDLSPKTLLKRLKYGEKISFNPPAPKHLVQRDQSPNTQGPSPGGSIPHHPGQLSWGNNNPLFFHDKWRFSQNLFNPPVPKHLVQGDQSPNTQSYSPGGSIPQNFARKGEKLQNKSFIPPAPKHLVQGDQSPNTPSSSPGGSIPQIIAKMGEKLWKKIIQSPCTQTPSPGGSIPQHP